jgi:hypothetical protein
MRITIQGKLHCRQGGRGDFFLNSAGFYFKQGKSSAVLGKEKRVVADACHAESQQIGGSFRLVGNFVHEAHCYLKLKIKIAVALHL